MHIHALFVPLISMCILQACHRQGSTERATLMVQFRRAGTSAWRRIFRLPQITSAILFPLENWRGPEKIRLQSLGLGSGEEELGAGGQTHPQIQSWCFRLLKYFVFSSSSIELAWVSVRKGLTWSLEILPLLVKNISRENYEIL